MDKKELRKKFSNEWQKHYDLEFFKKYGFKRQKCKICGKYFWSLEERETCEDPEHENYKFIGKKIKEMKYVEVWNKMKKAYEQLGIKPIDRYPVAARWRNDLDFTIASIANFQPYVVNGEVEPPANPLLVPQPCLRFNDVKNVGITGRHMTCFVMVGHHAFNKDKLFYWKEEAIEHTFKILTEDFGVNPEKLIFIEDVWAGGGNFGPCIEYFADGLELGNIVFMQYAQTDEGYKELPTKVVDHGIGLNRWAWYVNGAVNAYEVVFEEVLKFLKSKYNLKPEQFKEFFVESAKLDFEECANQDEELKKILDKIYDIY